MSEAEQLAKLAAARQAIEFLERELHERAPEPIVISVMAVEAIMMLTQVNDAVGHPAGRT